MAGRVAVEMLGGFRVERPDGLEAAGWARPSAKRLLCLVLLTPGRAVERDRAARLLFPRLAPPRAVNAVAKATGWCRAALGFSAGEGLTTADGWLRWQLPVDTDVDAVLAAVRDTPATREARWAGEELAMLRGVADDHRELLPEWGDEWLTDFRDELRRARSTVAAALAARLELGTSTQVREAAARWSGLVETDPLDERCQAGLIRALLLAGREAEAHSAYSACRATLWTELGAEPGAEVQAAWRTDVGGADAERTVDVPRLPRPGAHLPGRRSDVEALVTALGDPGSGRGAAAVLVGDAGIGKSTVLAAVVGHVRDRGWRVVTCAGTGSASPAYRTIAPGLRELTEGTVGAEIVRRFLTGPPRPSLPGVRPPTSERALHLRVETVLEAATPGPTLLVVDDVHAADPATLRLLGHLAARAGRRHWSLLVAARSPLEWAIPVHAIGPLPDRVIERIVRERLPTADEQVVSESAQRAAGNPLFAGEIALLMSTGNVARPVPPAAVTVLRDRLRTLPGPQRGLVPLVALAGQDATWPLVLRAATALAPQPGAPPAGDTVRLLLGSGLVSEHEGRLRPNHPLIGEAALALLRRPQRARLHDLLAQLLTGPTAAPEAAPRHRIEAFTALPDAARAGHAVAAAAQEAKRALEQGGNGEAADLARAALLAWSACEPEERERLRPDALDAHLVLGHALATESPAEADAAYAIGASQALTDDERARFVLARGWSRYSHGDHARAAQAYREGLRLGALSPVSRADLATSLGWVLAREGLYEQALAEIEEAVALVDPAEHPETAAQALDRKGMTLAFLGRPTEALATLDRAFEVVTQVESPSLAAAIQAHRGNVSGRLGQWDPALRYLDESVALARSVNDVYTESVAWWSRTDALFRKGDVTGALDANREEERALLLLDNPAHLSACRRRRARLVDPAAVPGHSIAGRTP